MDTASKRRVAMQISQKAKRFIVLISLLLLAAVPCPATSVKTANSNVIFILDASGSMWGQISGKPKIQIAKEVMNDLIDHLPSDLRAGLMAYGHRRKGDCHDIELLVPVGRLDPSKMKARINAISPKGKTPLTAAVRQAAEKLHYNSQRATVVLVSDGLETCGGNPCELAEKLTMSGVDFTVHVIGFDLSKQEQRRLRCLADKTGGLFLAAGNAAALRDALFTTIKKVQAPPPPVKEKPGKATLKGPATVPAGAAFKVVWKGPGSRRDFIAIAKKGSRDLEYVDYVFIENGNTVRMIAPGNPGVYELRYVHAHSRQVIGRADIKIIPVTAKVEAPASAKVASKIQVKWKGPGYDDDYITIARPGQPPGSYIKYNYVSEGNPLEVQAPADPGTYEVRYIMGKGSKLLAKTGITIKGVTAKLEAPASAKVASKIQVKWKGPGYDDDYICISRPDQSPGGYVEYNYVSEGNPLKVQAPADPGTYEVRYIMDKGNKLLAKTSITIKGVTAKVEAPASAKVATKITVKWEGPGYDDDYITIARSDQPPGSYIKYEYVTEGNPLKVQAPADPGTYEVRYIMGKGSKLLAKKSITIKKP